MNDHNSTSQDLGCQSQRVLLNVRLFSHWCLGFAKVFTVKARFVGHSEFRQRQVPKIGFASSVKGAGRYWEGWLVPFISQARAVFLCR